MNKNNKEPRYKVINDYPYFRILDTKTQLFLPFKFISRQYADMNCYDFIRGGSYKVRQEYYKYFVAGNHPVGQIPKPHYPFESLYEEWMWKNRNMFE